MGGRKGATTQSGRGRIKNPDFMNVEVCIKGLPQNDKPLTSSQKRAMERVMKQKEVMKNACSAHPDDKIY